MPKEISISKSKFALVSAIYLIIPVIIFLLGFLKIYLAIPFSVLILASLIIYYRDFNKGITKNLLEDDKLSVSTVYLLTALVVVLVYILISGIGEFTWSTIDHRVRWPILTDLIDYKWPVIYDFKTQSNPAVREILGDGSAAFGYYFTIWMVPALIGKVFGLMAARITLLIWSALGLYLILIGVGLWEKKLGVIALLGLLFFGGLDVLPYTIKTFLGIGVTWEGWNEQMYIHGSYSQMMNVFHQCIPGWLVTLLVVSNKNNRSLGFIGSLMFCYSPWATIGLLPIALCQLFRKDTLAKDAKTNLKNIFGFNNLVVPMIILLVFAPFFTANPDATSVRGFIWNFIDGGIPRILGDYLLYIVIEFGVWILIVCKDYKKDPLLWVLFIELLIFPVYNISYLNDLLMRGSMAPMFVLMLMVIKVLDDNVAIIKNTKFSDLHLKEILIVFVAILSALTQFKLFTVSVDFTFREPENKKEMREQIGSFGNINDETETDMVDLQFFVENYEETFFFKYLAK